MSSAIKFPCKICENNVTNSDKAIHCDLCDSWVHIKSNDLNYIDYINSSKILMILGFVSHAVGKFFCSALCKTISNFYGSNKSKNIVGKDGTLARY